MSQRGTWVVVVVALTGCGDVVVGPAGDGDATTTSGVTTSTGAAGGATVSSSGQGGVGGAGGGMGAGGQPVGGAPPLSEACAATQHVVLSAPTIVAGGDDVLSPGEVGSLQVTLTSPVEHHFYPGIVVRTDHSGVIVGDNWLFGLLPNEPVSLGVSLEAKASVAVGTVVQLDIEAATLNEDCPGVHAITHVVVVQ